MDSKCAILHQLFSDAGITYQTAKVDLNELQLPILKPLLDIRARFDWLKQCVSERFSIAQEMVKTRVDLDDKLEVLKRLARNFAKHFAGVEWAVVEEVTWETMPATVPIIEQLRVGDPIPGTLENNMEVLSANSQTLSQLAHDISVVEVDKCFANESDYSTICILLPDQIQGLRVRVEKHVACCLELLTSYRPLADTLKIIERSIHDKGHLSDLLSLNVAKVEKDDWMKLRRDVDLEQQSLAKLSDDLRSENLSNYFSVASAKVETFINSLKSFSTSATQCPAYLFLETQLTLLTELFFDSQKKVFSLQQSLSLLANKGDVYQEALISCETRLDEIGGELDDTVSCARLEGEMETWVVETQQLVNKVTCMERRLCDFQTGEFEALLVASGSKIEATVDSELLPFAVQEVHERWSDLINRAMNFRSAAEVAVNSIQEVTDSFNNTVAWMRGAQAKLLKFLEEPPNLPATASIVEESENDSKMMTSTFLINMWTGIADTRSLRVFKITVSILLFDHISNDNNNMIIAPFIQVVSGQHNKENGQNNGNQSMAMKNNIGKNTNNLADDSDLLELG